MKIDRECLQTETHLFQAHHPQHKNDHQHCLQLPLPRLPPLPVRHYQLELQSGESFLRIVLLPGCQSAIPDCLPENPQFPAQLVRVPRLSAKFRNEYEQLNDEKSLRIENRMNSTLKENLIMKPVLG